MPKKIKLDIDIAPKVEVGKVEEAEVVVSPQPLPNTPVVSLGMADSSVEGEELDDDEREEKEELKEEADFEGETVESLVGNNQQLPAQLYNSGQQAYVEDIENELGKFKLLVQGSDTRDSYLGNSLPFDMALSNIKTPEERAIFRLDAEAYLEAASLFGRDSPLASELLQILKSDIMVSRADNSTLSKLLVTNISQNFTDKTVSRSDKQMFSTTDKAGLFNRSQTPQPSN